MGFAQYSFDRLLHALAESMGLELVPQCYDVQFTSGVQVNTQRLTPDAGDGPFIITELFEFAGIATTNNREIEIQSGSRRVTDGRVLMRAIQEFAIPASNFESIAGMPPIVVMRTEALTLIADATTGNTLAASNLVLVRGYTVRRARTHERLGAEADHFAIRVLQEIGELYALGLTAPSGGGQTSFPTSRPSTWIGATTVFSAAATAVRLRVGMIELFPRNLPLFAALANSGPATFPFGMLASKAGDLVEFRVDGGSTSQITLVGLKR